MTTKDFMPISEVQPHSGRSLWAGRIPIGGLTLLEGLNSVGKSRIMMRLAAAVTRGKSLADTSRLSAPANVFWLSGEDDLSSYVRPGLKVAGADLNRVFVTSASFTLNESHLIWLGDQISKHNPLMLVIDPIWSYLHGDPHKFKNIQSLTNALKNIAATNQCAIVMVRNLGNPTRGKARPGSGPSDLRAAVGSALVACFHHYDEDPANENGELMLIHSKSNYGQPAPHVYYKINPDGRIDFSKEEEKDHEKLGNDQ